MSKRARVGDCQPSKTRALVTWFIYLTLHKMGDAIQLFWFIKEVHNCPAAWDVSFLPYKETKNKQKKAEVYMELLLGGIPTNQL